MSRAKQRDFISDTNFSQRETWSVQTLVNLFLETGGSAVLCCGAVVLCCAVLGAIPLSPNSSETAWNFETPFYRKEDGSMRMVYVYL